MKRKIFFIPDYHCKSLEDFTDKRIRIKETKEVTNHYFQRIKKLVKVKTNENNKSNYYDVTFNDGFIIHSLSSFHIKEV